MLKQKCKYGLLVTTPAPEQRVKNIGDYMQTVAALQFYPRVDRYVPREFISEVNDAYPIKVVMNSWWMWHPENWPPKENILPLPISMHISPMCADVMLSEKGYEWFKKYEPIGCRDNATYELLTSKGINAYYSSCLTLTLFKDFPPVNENERKGVYFVDPYQPMSSGTKVNIKVLFHFLTAPYTILSLCGKPYFEEAQSYNDIITLEKNKWWKVLRFATLFHQTYSSMFSNKMLREAEFIHHCVDVTNIKDDDTLIDMAKELIKKYQYAKIVVSSRIHCALPCLAMETPIVFIEHPAVVGDNWNANRLTGLLDLFRVVKHCDSSLKTNDPILLKLGAIQVNTTFENKSNWRVLASKLQDKIEIFFGGGANRGCNW